MADHILRTLLPHPAVQKYNLRNRPHGRQLALDWLQVYDTNVVLWCILVFIIAVLLFILLLFYCSIAFCELVINKYVMLCYATFRLAMANAVGNNAKCCSRAATDWRWGSVPVKSSCPAAGRARRQCAVRTGSPCCPRRRACSDTSDPSSPGTPICRCDSAPCLRPSSNRTSNRPLLYYTSRSIKRSKLIFV